MSETVVSDDPQIDPKKDDYPTKLQTDGTCIDCSCSLRLQRDLQCDVWFHTSNSHVPFVKRFTSLSSTRMRRWRIKLVLRDIDGSKSSWTHFCPLSQCSTRDYDNHPFILTGIDEKELQIKLIRQLSDEQAAKALFYLASADREVRVIAQTYRKRSGEWDCSRRPVVSWDRNLRVHILTSRNGRVYYDNSQ